MNFPIRNFQRVLRYSLLILANLRFYIGDILKSDLSQPITISLFLLSLLSVDYRHFNLKFYLILFLLTISSFKLGGPSFPLIILFLISSCLSNEKIQDLAKISLLGQLLFLIFMIYQIGSGGIEENISIHDKGVLKDWGFGNANTFSMYLASIIFTGLIICVKQTPVSFISLIFLPLIILSYYLTIGRTYFAGELVTIILIAITFFKRTVIYKIRYLIILYPILSLGFIFLFTLTGLNTEFLNHLVTGRLTLWFNHLGFFFSEGNLWVGYDVRSVYDFPLDCSPLTLFINNGIIGYILYSSFIMIGVKNCINHVIYYVPIICGIFFSALTENILLPLSPINLLFITILYKEIFKVSSTFRNTDFVNL